MWRVHLPWSGWQYFETEEEAVECKQNRVFNDRSKPEQVTLIQIIQELSDALQKIEDNARGPMS